MLSLHLDRSDEMVLGIVHKSGCRGQGIKLIVLVQFRQLQCAISTSCE